MSGRWIARGAFALGIVLGLAYAPLDRLLVPEQAGPLFTQRVVIAALLGIVLLVSFTPLFRTHYVAVASAGPLLTAASFLVMVAITESDAPDYHRGLALTIVAVHTLFRFPHLWAMLLSALIVLAYLAVAPTATPISGAVLASHIAYLVSVTVVAGFASYGIERYARRAFLDRRSLEAEQERSERLLLNVLPEAIAERLKADERPIADDHDEASVLFADLVGFSARAAGRSPADVVDELNRVFTAFDQIVEDAGVEKIKTIGDGYMAVAGVPLGQPDHAERIAAVALEMRDAVRPPLALRVGIASGPVVAGVIGERKFSYDLWGDTVNTASRMESLGEPGAIQITDDLARRLGDRFTLRQRGEIDVKGKGTMRTWWLDGHAQPPTALA